LQDWTSIKWGFSLSQEPVGEGVEIVLPMFVNIVKSGVRALLGVGYYDWACPPFGADYVATRVPPEDRDHVRVIHYESGHGVPMAAFNADAARFVADVLKEPPAEAAEEHGRLTESPAIAKSHFAAESTPSTR
jgi:hypothetical protein